jgi:hypothetical protein
MIPLVVALWQGAGYQGAKRLLVDDMPNLERAGFNDATLAVGIHPGPDYTVWMNSHGGQKPFAVLYEDADYEGAGWKFIGGLPDLGPYALGSSTSSVRICPPLLREGLDQEIPGIKSPDPGGSESPTLDSPIRPIPLVVELFTDAQYGGNRITVVENSASLAADFGGAFGGSVSSVQVMAGPDFNGQKALLFENEGFTGERIALEVGSYPDLGAWGNFNDRTCSVTVR